MPMEHRSIKGDKSRRDLLARALRPLAVAAVIMLAAAEADARARNCESMSGPARTDCFIARAHILGQRSGIAAGAARQLADDELLRAATGTSLGAKRHRAKSKGKSASQ